MLHCTRNLAQLQRCRLQVESVSLHLQMREVFLARPCLVPRTCSRQQQQMILHPHMSPETYHNRSLAMLRIFRNQTFSPLGHLPHSCPNRPLRTILPKCKCPLGLLCLSIRLRILLNTTLRTCKVSQHFLCLLPRIRMHQCNAVFSLGINRRLRTGTHHGKLGNHKLLLVTGLDNRTHTANKIISNSGIHTSINMDRLRLLVSMGQCIPSTCRRPVKRQHTFTLVNMQRSLGYIQGGNTVHNLHLILCLLYTSDAADE